MKKERKRKKNCCLEKAETHNGEMVNHEWLYILSKLSEKKSEIYNF